MAAAGSRTTRIARSLAPTMRPRTGIDRNLNAVFADGMLQQVAMRQEDIAAEWPKLRAREPIEGIELLVGEGIWAEQKAVAAARELSRLRVSAQDWFTAHSVAAILAWGMPKLRVLELENCDLGTLGAQLLANEDTTLGDHDPEYRKPPPFAKDQLEELALSGGSIGDEGAALIFAAPHLAKLRALDLKGCKLTARSLERLREAPAMRGLRRLGLANNADAGAQLGALAGWSVLANLERLAVPQATTAAGLGALFPAPSPTLRELALVSAKELAQWPGLAGIAEAFIELDLGTTSLGDTRWAGLLAAPSARSLVHLHANGCSLSDAAIDTLAASPLERLVTLDLSSNKLSDAGLETLAAWPGLQHVTRLSLYNNRKLTAAGISALAAAPQFQPARLVISKAAASNELAARFGDALVLR